MRTAVWYNNRDIRIEDAPTPRPGPGELLVRVHACGICGSDVVEWYRLPRAPLVPGHEMGGEVVEAGPSVRDWQRGDRVFVAPKVPCLQCRYCTRGQYPVCSNVPERLPGALAEYVLVPEALVRGGTYRLPDSLSYDQATFVEPLACAVRAQRLAGVEGGQTVLVTGCGMSGMLHIKLALRAGCSVAATDLNPARLLAAEKQGVRTAIAAGEDVPGQLMSAHGHLADVVLLCTGALPAVEQAWESVDKGGAVVFFAVPGPDRQVTVPVNRFWTREIRVLTSYYCGPDDIRDAIEILATGRIDVRDMITNRLPLEKTAEAFRLVQQGGESLKVIVHPNS